MTTTVVVGGGIAGLTAARAAAISGDDVTVLEASERWGGSVAGVELAGVPVDLGAESFASRGTAVASLARAVGAEIVEPSDAHAFLDLGARAVPLPVGVLGIPAFPLADDVRAAIGVGGSVRAFLDRVIPELHVGRHRDLGSLVRRRMGRAVLDTLVRPVVEGVYGVDPDAADIDVLLPGLNGALTQTGSLSSAVLRLREAAPAGSAVSGLRGGVHRLVDGLLGDLPRFGVRLHPATAVSAIRRDSAGWDLDTRAGSLRADRVILAVPGVAARDLMAQLVPAEVLSGWPESRTSVAYALALDAPELDGAPRGTGVLVASPASGRPSALTHSSAKWPWLRELLPAGRHVVRLNYPGATVPDLDTAVADAGALLGVPIASSQVVDHRAATWRQDAPRAMRGVRDRVALLEQHLAAADGLAVTGAWVAGTGLASVIPHAQGVGAAPQSA